MASEPTERDRDAPAVIALILATLAAGLVLALVWCGAALSALATGHPAPPFTAGGAWGAIRHPAAPEAAWGTPMPAAGLVWSATGIITALVVATVVTAVLAWRRRHGGTAGARTGYPDGTAERRDVARVAGRAALMARASRLRPSLDNPQPGEVGHRLGCSRGVDVYSTVEDSRIILGPPRSGKGLHLVIPMILDAPGAVVTTSTRPDNITATLTARQQVGPVAVFDPQQLAPGIPGGLRWSPVRGCEEAQTAMVRARGLASASEIGGKGVENGGFWQGQTEAALRGMLHAAALDNRGAADLYRWSIDPVAALEAVRVLTDHPRAATGWAAALEAAATADERTRDSIWLGVRQALGSLAAPHVLDAVSPGPGEQFDPAEFLTSRGTLYLLGTATGAGNAAPLISAFIEDMVETARKLAAAAPAARLDPPLSLVLDEIGNLVPLNSLPTLMSEGGGTGLVTTAVFQSLAQLRAGWGDDTAHTIWESAIAKIILGGASTSKDLQDLATLIGERDDETVSLSRSTGRGDKSRSRQTSLRRVPILDTAALRTLPFGTGVLMLRSAAPIMLDLTAWTSRDDADRIDTNRREVETRIGDAFAAQAGTTATTTSEQVTT
ncbi:type IV secretory pathway TraG/TraD family ATPase VirD4 [Haloactinopolyspora alba]|uniref:Type IV secretory pathway TraG/TraD family ATPase VirD4 n=1 Tax=Haloactinopolyspora alba TaxID=648780 RepID=A0A2P8EFG5_9ACTN|nr:TraM recognition domain-containing protein [Haloactinopolyspora alba]PSL08174.1 type IV secretory pathway TraG/TraD family ATPase VirD4 [Haloactinopolyspora alba]